MCSQVVYGETVWWSLLACLRQRYIINSNVQEVKHFFLEMTSAGHTIPLICQHIVYRISYIVYRISYIVYRISYIVYRISHIVYRISYIAYRISYIYICVTHVKGYSWNEFDEFTMSFFVLSFYLLTHCGCVPDHCPSV